MQSCVFYKYFKKRSKKSKKKIFLFEKKKGVTFFPFALFGQQKKKVYHLIFIFDSGDPFLWK